MARSLGSAGRWRAVCVVACVAVAAAVAPAPGPAAAQEPGETTGSTGAGAVGDVGEVEEEVPPTLVVDPAEARIGDVVSFGGGGWCCEGGEVGVQDELTGTFWGEVSFDRSGDLEGELTVPDGAGVGDNLLSGCTEAGQCATAPLLILDPEVVEPTDPEVLDPGVDPGDPATGDPADVLQPTAATGGDGGRPWLVAGAVVLAVVVGLLLWRVLGPGRDPSDRRTRPRRRARVRAGYGPGSAALAGPAVSFTVHLDPRDPGRTTLVERRTGGRS